MLELPDTLRLNDRRGFGGSGFLSVLDLLHDLAANQVRVWLEGDQLRFKAPKKAFTPQLRERLKASKEEVIAHLRKDLGVRTAESGIPKADRDKPLPLSYAQQRLWFIDQWDPGKPTYNISFCFQIDGELDTAALEGAFGDVIARHESLRTVFPSVDSQPYQRIIEDLPPNMAMADFSTIEVPKRIEQARQWVTDFVQQPFDLGEGPLVRLAVGRLTENSHLLTVVLHHIIADGWSLDVLLSEWATCYSARLAGKVPSLEALPVQYPDFSVWQRQWLDDGEMDRQLKFWEQELAQPRENSQLPTDFRRPKTLGHGGDLCFFAVDEKVFAKLRKYREAEGATPFMTFLTAFLILLYRHSGQEDILVGTPLAQRDRGELENMIGFLVNTLIIRANLEQQPSFEDLHRQIQEKTLSSFAHADIPFEKLVEEFQPERDPSRNPIIQVMFSMHNKQREELKLPGCRLAPFEYQVKVAHFDLTMGFEVQGDALAGFIEYSTDLFSAETIAELASRFQRLLAEIADNPKKSIGEFSILDEEEQADLLASWRSVPMQDRATKSWFDIIAEKAETTPDVTVLRSGTLKLTAEAFHARSNALAQGLRLAGVGPGSGVLVDLPLCADWMVAALGIAKAGGVFIPLDSRWSSAVVESVTGMCKPVLEIKTEDASGQPVEGIPRRTLASLEKDGDATGNGEESKDWHVAIFQPDAFGNVRGIQLDQLFFQRTVQHWRGEVLPEESPLGIATSPADPATCLAAIAAVMADIEIVLPEPGQAEDLAEISAWVEASNLKGLVAPLDALDEYLAQHAGSTNLQTLIVADADNATERRGFSHALGTLKVHHLLGDLVRLGWTAVGSQEVWLAGPASSDVTEAVLSPVDSKSFLITDQAGQIVPNGIPGQVWMNDHLAVESIDGKALAGHWQADPYGSGTDAKRLELERKGRRLRDGRVAIEMPVQGLVRTHGHAVDLSQLDAVLESHPKIAQAKTNFTKASGQWSRLETWYRVKDGGDLDSKALISYLEEQRVEVLPEAWHHVDAIILDHHGQVLFERLHGADLETPVEFGEEPRTPQEWAMAMIWADVLNLPTVKLSDNFFTLGGHSLLAVQILSRVSDVFDQQLPIRVLFEHPTLGAFASQIAMPGEM